MEIVVRHPLQRLARILGVFWALPVTLVGVLLAVFPVAVGWYEREGVHDSSFVFSQSTQAPMWLHRFFSSSGSFTIGNTIVLEHSADSTRGRVALKHELVHAQQWRVFGVFFPLIKLLFWAMMLPLKNVHGHYDSPLEVDARRAAGQPIDVVGALDRIAKKMEKKK